MPPRSRPFQEEKKFSSVPPPRTGGGSRNPTRRGRPAPAPVVMPLFPRLTNIRLLNEEEQGVSDSLILLAKMTGVGEVVIKFGLPSTPTDNSLEVERKMYMMVTEQLLPTADPQKGDPRTPHLLGGLEVGQVSGAEFLTLSKRIQQRWADLVMGDVEWEIIQELNKEENAAEEEEGDESQSELSASESEGEEFVGPVARMHINSGTGSMKRSSLSSQASLSSSSTGSRFLSGGSQGSAISARGSVIGSQSSKGGSRVSKVPYPFSAESLPPFPTQQDEEEEDLEPEEVWALVEKFTVNRLKVMEYVITPRKGVTLLDFLMDKKNAEIYSERVFVLSVAMQVAQLLAVFEANQIMHHDLHIKNLFITFTEEPKKIHHTYPFSFSFESNVEITAYDYDHISWGPLLRNRMLEKGQELCDGDGQCNHPFTPKYDWYTFLTYFIGYLELKEVNGLRLDRQRYLREVLYDTTLQTTKPIPVNQHIEPKYDADSSLGHPCRCVAVKYADKKFQRGGRCVKCVINKKRLESVLSPTEFLRMRVASND